MIKEVVKQYFSENVTIEMKPLSIGNIHKTYEIKVNKEKYILQKMNTYVFSNPKLLMENIINISRFLRKKAIFYGKNPDQSSIEMIPNKEGNYFTKINNSYYRVYRFIPDSYSVETTQDLNLIYECGAAIGRFDFYIQDFPMDQIYISIPNFHNVKLRFEALKKEIEKRGDRFNEVYPFYTVIASQEKKMNHFQDAMQENNEFLGICHNDTKISNILFSKSDNKALCLIDFDTIMPGCFLYDYADCLRGIISNIDESEISIPEVSLRIRCFEEFSKGYFKEMPIKGNRKYFVEALEMITLELAIRFFLDYLQHDIYFYIKFANQNLIRGTNQFHLYQEIIKNESILMDLVCKI